MIRFPILFATLLIIVSCSSPYKNIPSAYHGLLDDAFTKSGENTQQLHNALNLVSNEQKEAMAFLIAYMPENDLKTLNTQFLLNQVEYAFIAKNNFDWCAKLPDSIFFNNVLPYANFDEKRDNWRADFYMRFSQLVKNCTTINQAIDSVNLNIRDNLMVDYNTKRSIVNISPFQAIKEKMATCTGLSFLLVDAFRSVGIPARLAGTPLWTNMRGNHSWVEVWINRQWYFTEYYPEKLNHSWFLADAGKADPEKRIHWIYAASYKPADTYYPLVWDSTSTAIHGYNVTDRYIRLYQEQLAEKAINTDEVIIDIVLYENNLGTGNNRITTKVELFTNGEKIDFGFTPGPRDDLNKFLKFKLKKNQAYILKYSNANGEIIEETVTAAKNTEEIKKLFIK